ncbi:amidohydrolase family protein [Curtobacterium sp. 24E2]|nr:amidohydrolase family protein [Curtobacterium sp. 24E2]
MTTLVRAPRIVTAAHDLHDGWLVLGDDATVLAVGAGTPPRADSAVTVEGTVVPGLVDLHAHGALGHDFATCSAADARAAAAHHRSRGTTTLVASIATGRPDDTVAALTRLRPLTSDGTLAGLHLEGPWLSPARRGAHRVDLLHAPDPLEVDTYLAAADGALRVVTLAPELPAPSTPCRGASPPGSSWRSGTPTPPPSRPAAPSTPAPRSSRTCSTACHRSTTARRGRSGLP